MAAPPRSGNSHAPLPRQSVPPKRPMLRGLDGDHPDRANPGVVNLNRAPLSRRARRTRELSQPAAADQPMVHSFRPKPKPVWLSLLIRCQQASSMVTLVLVVSVLVVYGWTVYIQQRWGQAYDKLEAFKKQERQLISANELLKNQIAEQAENPTAGLLLPDPSNAIFLTPAPQRPAVKPKSTVPPADSYPTKPLGY
jgi:hypothetical protein